METESFPCGRMMSLLSLDMSTSRGAEHHLYGVMKVGLIAVRAGVGLWVGNTAILTFLVLFGLTQKEQRKTVIKWH
jgi:hypothetical protein